MKTGPLVVTTALMAVLCVCEAVRFGQICQGNPRNRVRGEDSFGHGHFHSHGHGHQHTGVDIECNDGATVFAPFDVTIQRRVDVEGVDPRMVGISSGIELTGQGLCFRMLFLQPVQTTGTVKKGKKLGTMSRMQTVHPGITSHIHFEMCDGSDPTRYFQ
ncbi:leukocyte cell-derived chemotaxin-2-like [Lampris incognitus]|uniref:leukocyte cell-derived chemotaxin-2-like n=1 Tax=Lampris incognitus TaxID=2546036 RepID=UPI0024B4934B|nr:leukocyte cell-derived chemotaxin-2-like [Lampris incognitus]